MTTKFEAVLFDCDGVLVDSEPLTNGVLRDMLEESGWVLGAEECMRTFVGKAVKDERALIEARTGQPLTEAWMVRFRERRNQGLMRVGGGVNPLLFGGEGAVLEALRVCEPRFDMTKCRWPVKGHLFFEFAVLRSQNGMSGSKSGCS